jgi:trypsin
MKKNIVPHIIIASLVCLSILSCSKQSQDQNGFENIKNGDGHIVGGKDLDYKSAMATQIVYIASVIKSSGRDQICTGTFISNDIILTAAHCIATSKDMMSVYFRNKDFNKTQNIIDVPIVETFEPTFPELKITRNDLALIKFSGGLPQGAQIASLPSIEEKQLQSLSLNFSAIGYGRNTGVESDDAMDSTGEGSLRYKKMSSENLDISSDIFRVDQYKNDGGVCFGDSGGPALIKDKAGKYIVVGVASAVDPSRIAEGINPKDNCKNESLYLNMYYYAKTLREYIKTLK